MFLGFQVHQVQLDFLESKEIKDIQEYRVYQALQAWRDLQVPRVILAELAPLG